MKQATLLAAVLAASTLAIGPTGCSSLTHEEKVDNAATIANLAAYMGTGLHLEDNPDDAAFFEVAAAALAKFGEPGDFTPSDLAAALEDLPVETLQGSRGAILILGGVQIFDQAANRILDMKGSDDVRKVATAIRAGILAALEAHEASVVRIRDSPEASG